MSPTATATAEQASTLFSQQNWARGQRRYLFVSVIPHASDRCANYGFRSKEVLLVAYQTDCRMVTPSRRHDLFFYVALRNVDGQAGRYDLQNFTLRSVDGESAKPVGVLGDPAHDLIPDVGKLEPKSNVFGYLTFDADATTFVPRTLTYEDGTQTLTITFDGNPARARGGVDLGSSG